MLQNQLAIMQALLYMPNLPAVVERMLIDQMAITNACLKALQ